MPPPLRLSQDTGRRGLTRLAQDKTLQVFVTQTFPPAEAAAAHRAIMSGHMTGKIALIPWRHEGLRPGAGHHQRHPRHAALPCASRREGWDASRTRPPDDVLTEQFGGG